jgi:hypothetical protein
MEILLALAGSALLVSVTLASLLGRGWRRQLGLALVGVAAWALFGAYDLVRECPPDAYECLPGLGAIFAGWALLGIAAVAVVRERRARAAARARGGTRLAPPARGAGGWSCGDRRRRSRLARDRLRGCTSEIGVWIAGYALVGWLAGVGLAQLVRRRLPRPGRPAAVVAVLLLVFVSVVVGLGRRSLHAMYWGCPTTEELQREQSVGDVVFAFAESGVPLEPIPLPPANQGRPKYRGAAVFRHETPGATLFLAVCVDRCPIAKFKPPPGQRWRIGMDSGNNVPIWVTESGQRAGDQLLEASEAARRQVHPCIEYGSRCYIN